AGLSAALEVRALAAAPAVVPDERRSGGRPARAGGGAVAPLAQPRAPPGGPAGARRARTGADAAPLLARAARLRVGVAAASPGSRRRLGNKDLQNRHEGVTPVRAFDR